MNLKILEKEPRVGETGQCSDVRLCQSHSTPTAQNYIHIIYTLVLVITMADIRNVPIQAGNLMPSQRFLRRVCRIAKSDY